MLWERTRCGWRRGPCGGRAAVFLILAPEGKHNTVQCKDEVKKGAWTGGGGRGRVWGEEPEHQSSPAHFQICIESEKPIHKKSIPRRPQDILSAGLRLEAGLVISLTLSLFPSLFLSFFLFLSLFLFNSYIPLSLPFHPIPLSKTHCRVLT